VDRSISQRFPPFVTGLVLLGNGLSELLQVFGQSRPDAIVQVGGRPVRDHVSIGPSAEVITGQSGKPAQRNAGRP
jgi:hypothetical protein